MDIVGSPSLWPEAIDAFEKYRVLPKTRLASSYHAQLANEVGKRLRQLTFLDQSIRCKEGEYSRVINEHLIADNEGEVPPLTAAMLDALLELELLTESFYHAAHRIRSIVLDKDRPLPGLSTFECRGVRDTRNHLVEHPNGKSSGVYALSFSFGGPDGPIIKPLRAPHLSQVFPDRGVYPNAEEFVSNFKRLILNWSDGCQEPPIHEGVRGSSANDVVPSSHEPEAANQPKAP